MTVTQIKNRSFERRPLRQKNDSKLATWVMLSIFVFASAICVAWLSGESKIHQVFAHLNTVQQNPPLWLEVPFIAGEYLLAPTIVLLMAALIVIKVSPRPRTWSRLIVISILLALTIRYIVWRSLSTLNLDTPTEGIFSLGLFLMEMLVAGCGVIQFWLMLRMNDRSREADYCSTAVLDGTFTPSVDVLIPTYNEPEFILRRTVIGCQAMEYANKRIYLLDDTQRPEIQALAENLGCYYITRPDNAHAKAGNLNHAIDKTSSDLIVVFDADFVPTKNFLSRTVGFFQDETVALVQTPQSFYNVDPIARNLGLENVITPDEEVFYRQIQAFRDGAGSVTCSGTSFVVRRQALEAVGGFVTDSLSEDYFTGICLSAKGFRLVYLNEKLSAGLAAENMAAYVTQRLRWARGTLQAFFIEANPLTIPGLNPIQRLAHLEGLLCWFTSWSRLGFLLMPLAYSFLDVIPVRATAAELLYYFLPYYVIQLVVFSWLNDRSRSALLSDIYSVVLAFPLAVTVMQVMLNPFARGFKVTPKGNSSHRFTFNWQIALPLIILFIATGMSFWRTLSFWIASGAWETALNSQYKGLSLGWFWSGYNLVILGITILILLDAPKADRFEWFELRRTARLTLPGVTIPDDAKQQSLTVSSAPLWGVTTLISEGGAEIALTQGLPSGMTLATAMPITIEIMEAQLKLRGIITQVGMRDEFLTVRVYFESLTMRQHRTLVEMLFCRPGQWKRWNSPGELRSLLILFRVLLKPRVLFDRKVDIHAMPLAKR
jgi:cellulose synthase (UDP-forming)